MNNQELTETIDKINASLEIQGTGELTSELMFFIVGGLAYNEESQKMDFTHKKINDNEYEIVFTKQPTKFKRAFVRKINIGSNEVWQIFLEF